MFDTLPPTRLLFLMPAILLLICTPSPGSDSGDPWVPTEVEIAAGTSQKIVTSKREGGFRRSFRLHVPAGFDPERSYPLVVALHGGLASAKTFEKQSNLSATADEHGFFVVYPNGIGIFSLLRHWNGGYCCARARKTDLDDPAFLDRVRAWVSDHYPIERTRHYVVGYSNGGMLAYWYAATRADELAGLGIWASSIARSPEGTTGKQFVMPWPETPVPAIIAHGMEDPRLPFEQPSSGENGHGENGRKRADLLLGAKGSARAWAGANGCSGHSAPTHDRIDRIEESAWCRAELERAVLLIGVEGWDHDWPGPRFSRRLAEDHPLHGYDLAKEIWRFFESLRP